MTQTAPPANWQQGWGFQYTSPTGDINNATQTRNGGTTYNVVTNWDGTKSYVPVTAPPGTTSPTPSTSADSSAKAIIDGALGQYGLQSLSSWAWSKWQAGESVDQIMLELRGTPEYKTRFPAMEALSQRGRAISEAQYINYEQSASAIFKAAGLPANFYDTPDDFANFLKADVALPELQSRVQAYQSAAFSAPQAVRDELQNLYGVSSGELTAFFIDPDKALPLVQQRYAAAQAAGWSDITGFGGLNRSQAEQVGNLGLSNAQLGQTFGQLAGMSALYSPLQGTSETGINQQTALQAGFFDDAAAQRELEARKAGRLSTFQGGGQVATTQQGAVGAGQAF